MFLTPLRASTKCEECKFRNAMYYRCKENPSNFITFWSCIICGYCEYINKMNVKVPDWMKKFRDLT